MGNNRRHGDSGLLERLLKRWRNTANANIRAMFKMFPVRCYRFTVQGLQSSGCELKMLCQTASKTIWLISQGLTHQEISAEPVNKHMPVMFGFFDLQVLQRIEIIRKKNTLIFVHFINPVL